MVLQNMTQVLEQDTRFFRCEYSKQALWWWYYRVVIERWEWNNSWLAWYGYSSSSLVVADLVLLDGQIPSTWLWWYSWWSKSYQTSVSGCFCMGYHTIEKSVIYGSFWIVTCPFSCTCTTTYNPIQGSPSLIMISILLRVTNYPSDYWQLIHLFFLRLLFWLICSCCFYLALSKSVSKYTA